MVPPAVRAAGTGGRVECVGVVVTPDEGKLVVVRGAGRIEWE